MQSHAAGFLLRTKDNRALFLKRSDKSQAHPGEWCCPGGSVEGGETPLQAAHRELQEETMYSGRTLGASPIDEAEGFATFGAEVEEFTPVLNDEHTEFRWAPMDAPPEPLHPGVAATLKKLRGHSQDAEFKENEHPRNESGEFSVALTGHELGEHLSVASLREAAMQHAETHLIGKSFKNEKTGAEIQIRRSGIKKSIAGKHSDSLRAMPALPQLLQKADYLGSNPDTEGRRNIKAVHGYEGRVSLAGENRTMRIIVRETTEGHLHYDHYLELEKERPSVPEEGSHDGAQSHRVSGGPFMILPDSDEDSKEALDRREYDQNNWFEVLDNPLSKVGVYQYSEASIRKGGDRSKMVGVYRPAEELGSQECIDSFKLMPWTDDHPSDLLGDKSQGFVAAEEKGVHGVIGEKVYFQDGTLYGNLKVFSEQLASKIAGGKKQLSCGYHCDFLEDSGTYDGVPYQYVQKNMRGNHVASVQSGRMGSDVRVLDSVESFTFAFDLKESVMREDEIKDCLDAETEKFIGDSFNSLVGELQKKGYSKEYATKVAGKVAAEKGKNGHDSSKSTGDTAMAKDANVKDPVKEDDKPNDKASPGAGDAETSEEEMDSKEASCDAAEEEKDKEDESKEARDRRRARDRRAGARDARKMARDKRAKDAEGKEDKKGMDAAEVSALVQREVAKVKVPSMDEIVAQVRPTIRREEAAKASLYGKLSPAVGAFDHSEMSHTDMAAYGLKQLGAKDAADPITALDYLLAGRAQVAEAPHRRAAAQDSGGENFLDRYLNS